MGIIAEKVKSYLENFIKLGGLAVIIVYLVDGKMGNALVAITLFIVISISTDGYFK